MYKRLKTVKERLKQWRNLKTSSRTGLPTHLFSGTISIVYKITLIQTNKTNEKHLSKFTIRYLE